MKIIDSRCRPNTPEFMAMYNKPANAGTWKKFGYPCPPDVSLDTFLDNLDKAGIYKGIFLGRQVYQPDGVTMVKGVTNDYVKQCVDNSHGKLVGVAGVDPLHTDAAAELDRAVNELGLKGVSIDLDTFSVYPQDRILFPIFDKAQKLGVAVSFTMGPLVGRFSHPDYIDIVAGEFPDLRILCSHGCYPQVTEFIGLAYRCDNVWLEASIYEFLPGATPIIEAANGFLSDKIVYGSAFPFNPIEIIDTFKKFPISEENMEKVLYKNVCDVYKID